MRLPTLRVDHRPYALPEGQPAMQMRWNSLAFLHWPVEKERIAAHLPSGLDVDTFEGRAYVGVVPFEMDRTRFRWLPPIPTTSRFFELNVRTYVVAGGRPGVWFFSLDATSRIAVRVARASFGLPYLDAEVELAHEDGWVRSESERTHRGASAARLAARYRPVGAVSPAVPGTLEHFLAERYCMYSAGRRGLLRGEIHHAPWPLQRAEAEVGACDLTRGLGFELEGPPSHAHYSDRLDVVAWWPTRIPNA